MLSVFVDNGLGKLNASGSGEIAIYNAVFNGCEMITALMIDHGELDNIMNNDENMIYMSTLYKQALKQGQVGTLYQALSALPVEVLHGYADSGKFQGDEGALLKRAIIEKSMNIGARAGDEGLPNQIVNIQARLISLSDIFITLFPGPLRFLFAAF